MKKGAVSIIDKKISEKKLKEMLDRGKELVSTSGALVASVGKELNRIKEDERKLREKLSVML